MKRAKVKELQGNEWQIEGELVLKEGKVYVPKDVKLRAEIIQLYLTYQWQGMKGNGRQHN